MRTRSLRDLEEVEKNYMPEISAKEHKIVMRTVSMMPDGINSFSGSDVDMYMSSLLASGWKIVNVFQVANPPEGTTLAWILVR